MCVSGSVSVCVGGGKGGCLCVPLYLRLWGWVSVDGCLTPQEAWLHSTLAACPLFHSMHAHMHTRPTQQNMHLN